jgi:purine-binding chemotaxis protein CheW
VKGIHVRVRIGPEDYALPIESVTEVAELGEVTPVPGAPADVLGARNLRGHVLPVIDMAAVFGLSSGSPSFLIVADHDGSRAGLAVDAVAGVEPLPDVSEEAESEHLLGATLIDAGLVGVVDVKSVLDAVGAEAAGG